VRLHTLRCVDTWSADISARDIFGISRRRKLHVGAGDVRLEGWLNSDIAAGTIYLDIRKPLPFKDSAFSDVFGEHVIEHIPEDVGVLALREFHRVIKPGGVLRLTTPDLRKLLALYEDNHPDIALAEYIKFFDGITGRTHARGCQVLNDFMRLWGHRFIYDEEDITSKLGDVGFVSVQIAAPGESTHEGLRAIERHEPKWLNQVEAMAVEATKGEE
jgi:predicted SAM-dependent methyltransferase